MANLVIQRFNNEQEPSYVLTKARVSSNYKFADLLMKILRKEKSRNLGTLSNRVNITKIKIEIIKRCKINW